MPAILKTIYFVGCMHCCFLAKAQESGLQFHSTDTALQTAFNWAKAMAMQYRGNPDDAVGPWYEAALPSRNAFCVRDFSHQCIAAMALGMRRENENMLQRFISNISASKDWCTYWEIDKWNKPCPADYKNDSAFWYNLNANFELLYTSERLYRWTGNRSIIAAPAATYFFERSLNDYIRQWTLQPDSLLTRPAIANKRSNYASGDNFTGYRGLPSYVESVEGMVMSADLLAAIYRGCTAFSYICSQQKQIQKSKKYAALAAAYKRRLQQQWKQATSQRYNTCYTANGAFTEGEGALFLLWYEAVSNTAEIKALMDQLLQLPLNVESTSYLPRLFYRQGYPSQARNYILHLGNSNTQRREYPEVSFGMVEGIVQGLMGIDADAAAATVSTCYNGADTCTAVIEGLPIFDTQITVLHQGTKASAVTNSGTAAFKWKACFKTTQPYLWVNGKKVKASSFANSAGENCSAVVVRVKPGEQASAGIK